MNTNTSFKDTIIDNANITIMEDKNSILNHNSKFLFRTTNLPQNSYKSNEMEDRKPKFSKRVFLITKDRSNKREGYKKNTVQLFRIRKKSPFTNRHYYSIQRHTNKEYILKKIKLRFFKNYCKRYVADFLDYINKNKSNLIEETLEYKKLHYDFIKCIYPKKNEFWKIRGKSILEIYGEFSEIKLKELVQLFLENKEEFKNSLSTMSSLTRFIMLEPFETVYRNFLNNKIEFDKFVKRIKLDFNLEKKDYCEEDIDHLVRNFLTLTFYLK